MRRTVAALFASWPAPLMPAPFMLVLLLATGGTVSADAGAPRAPIPAAAGDTCVEPAGDMRREHMHMLMHQRDRTVHEAYRDKQHSLRGCVECHTNRTAEGQTMAVNADGQFCQSCHAYAAVKMDCFECHATTPDSGRRGTGGRR